MFLLYSSGDDSAEDKMQPRKPETESKSWAQPKRRFTDTSSTYSVTRAVFILTAVCLNWGSNMSTYLHRCIKITPCPFWDLEQRFISLAISHLSSFGRKILRLALRSTTQSRPPRSSSSSIDWWARSRRSHLVKSSMKTAVITRPQIRTHLCPKRCF